MNYIIYNHDGSIKNVNFADIIVQGNNLVDEIFVAVEGRSTDSYLATAYFELPNGDSNFLTATLASHSIDQSPYNGYKFLLTGAQTAFYGRVRMSIKLEGMQGETLWTYDQVLTINKSGYNPDFTMISMSQYAALLQAMGSLQEKYVVNNARFYSSLANAQADLDNLAFNQCVIIADVTATDPIPEIYFKNSESQLELLAGIGEYTFQAGTTTTQTLAPGSDATVSVSFVASGKTITMNFAFGIPKGDTGATGNGIASIAKVGTVGLVDTYRITFTDGSHFDYAITNGSIAGEFAISKMTLDTTFATTAKAQLSAYLNSNGILYSNVMAVYLDYGRNASVVPGDPIPVGHRRPLAFDAFTRYSGDDPDSYGVDEVNDFELTVVGDATAYTSVDDYVRAITRLNEAEIVIVHRVDVSVASVGYFELADTDLHSGTLTAEQAAEAAKDVCFIYYNGRMYYPEKNSQTTRVYKAIPHLESGSGSVQAYYEAGQISIALFGGQGIWSYAIERLTIEKTPTQNSTNLVTSGGVHSAIATASATLDAKILAVDDKVNYAIEAITKKDLYETQEATFQGMTAVPAGAMGKAYLDGFKGNSAVVNQHAPTLKGSTTWHGLTITNDGSSIHITGTCDETGAFALTNTIWSGNLLVTGHKYLLCVKTTANFTPNGDEYFYQYRASGDGVLYTNGGVVVTATGATAINPEVRLVSGNTYDFYVYWVMFIDLHQAALTDAEMATYSTAKAALKHKGMDVDSYIPYNAGTLTDCRITKLISNPYNLSDGVLEQGYWNGTTGALISSSSAVRSKNYIEVAGGLAYKIQWDTSWLASTDEVAIGEWDADFNYIKKTGFNANPSSVTLSSRTRYIKYYFYKSGVTVAAADVTKICFHIASANLGYKPHIKPAARVILPPEYQQVEYIQSSGTQYIDTGLAGDAGYEIRAELNFTALSTGDYQYFGGFAYTGSPNRVYYIRLNSSTNSLGYTYGSVNTDTTNLATLTANQWYDIDSLMNDKDQRMWLNGRLIGSSAYSLTGVDPTNPVNIYLFCSQYVSSASAYCQVKARRVRIFKDGNLVRDFVPCYKKSNNEVGMFDLVSGSFFANAGTGTFSKGDDCMETVYYLDIPTLKSAGSVQDESKAEGEKVGKLDLGTKEYIKSGYNFSFDTTIIKNPINFDTAFDGLCPKFRSVSYNQSFVDGDMGYGNGNLYFRQSTISTPEDFKTYVANTPLNYAKRKATDFSSTISYPEIIDVDAGGSIEVVGEGCDATAKVYFYVEA